MHDILLSYLLTLYVFNIFTFFLAGCILAMMRFIAVSFVLIEAENYSHCTFELG